MSWVLAAIIILNIFLVFSQFGGRLQASQALTWILFSAFLVISAVRPELWHPVIHLLGIRLVSNFVLAVSIFFLFLQLFEVSAAQATSARKMRRLVTNLAAQSFKPAKKPEEGKTKVLVVLPCYNEEESIPQLLPRLQSLVAQSKHSLEFCFVNDGSWDGTEQVLARIAPQNYVSHSANVNVAGVLMTGFQIQRRLDYDYVVQCDGDGQHPVEEIDRLVDEAARRRTDLLVASRFAKEGAPAVDVATRLQSTTFLRRLGSFIITSTLRILWDGHRCTDPTSGFRIFSKRACDFLLRHMPDEYPEPEAIALLCGKGYRVEEVYCAMNARVTGESSLKGFNSLRYMYKSISALVGLRLRTFGRAR